MARYDNTRHPDTTILLDFIEGIADDTASAHIGDCGECRTRIEEIESTRLSLNALPLRQAPDHLWDSVASAVDVDGSSPRSVPGRAWWYSLAASVVLVAGMVFYLLPGGQSLDEGELVALLDENRHLETTLANLDRRPNAMDLATAGRIVRIKDSISTLDETMNETIDRQDANKLRAALLRERVRLMRGLVETRAQPLMASYTAF